MNRKIFTLLASALMLFSTAFYVNAQRIVAEKSVGDLVKTLSGSGPGMYHIQIDSLRLPQNGGTWYPVTYDGGTISNGYFQYDATKGGGLNYTLNTVSLPGDTMILSVTEDGRVAMISASDLRHNFAAGKAFLTDLQATMWCINVLKDGSKGEWPTFHFTNKVFGQDLDWMNADETLLRGNDRGWMYSPSYLNGDLKSKMTLHRHEADSVGKYRVITAELDANGWPTGLLETRIVDIGEYIADTLSGMLKFSIVKISPFVMTADDFNSELGNTDGTGTVKLKFVPNPDVAPTSFTQNLRADSSNNIDARRLGYLNVKAYHEDGKIEGYIANSNQTKTDDTLKYNNKSSVEYLNLSAVEVEDETIMQNDNGNYNYSYRFVYFPSEDSLVINAYYAKHDLHNTYASNAYIDDDPYLPDAPGVKQFYYGLYNDTIHDYLIVRLQDLNKGAEHLLTVGEHPANVRISFGINSCNEEADAWKVSEGVYTIWDKRGRCLGVRIYNGSYSPQWIDLDEGECPDRIPSYQWVVEHSDLSSVGRINLHNREFGDLRPGAQNEDTFVDILNVLVKKNKEYQIFKHKRLFQYSPIIRNLQALYEYEPIINAYVKGQLLPVVNPQSDATCGIKAESGFRPVWNAFVQDQYLGYKHFCVNTDPNSPSFGKSDNVGKAKGMDYNAYAFNYLYYATDDAYIGSELSYDDNILNVSRTDKLGFQFMLGANLRANKYQEETFGYPRTAWSAREIYDQNGNKVVYTQTSVPVLKRYYYELKVADFYNYRDGLAEEYVVLKGEKIDGSKPENKLKYGLADIFSYKDPYKFANVYLRESYFLDKGDATLEERHEADPLRRIYYVLLDRIESDYLQKVTAEGLEVSDTLMGEDGTTPYNLVSIKVDDAGSKFLKAQGKTVSSERVSAFALENLNSPLYRRLRSIRDDGAVVDENNIDKTKADAPKVLRLFNHNRPTWFLHEDALSDVAYNYGINFLGFSNNIAETAEAYAPDGTTVNYNYHLFIDTAYINRGTGEIKPQYLIAVGVKEFEEAEAPIYETIPGEPAPAENPCRPSGNPPTSTGPKEKIVGYDTIPPYVVGRYLVNATDSARMLNSNGSPWHEKRDPKYIYNTSWDRLAFVPAIHVDDRLYIISELERRGITECQYKTEVTVGEKKEWRIDGRKLRTLVKDEDARKPENSNMYGAYYDFGEWNNYHNDVCFSFRYVQSGVQNPDKDGNDVMLTNEEKRFYIESETKHRTIDGNPKIAPVQGGWIKLQNFVPVLSRGSFEDAISNADIFNVAKPTGWQDGEPTLNEAVAGKSYVVAGTDEISILNAAGKQVTVTNLLGQTLVNKTLKGNNEKISIAKGLVIVNIEGEEAVKAIVK